MALIDGVQRVHIVHPDKPDFKLNAQLDFKKNGLCKLCFDMIPEECPEWLSETRVDRLWVVEPFQCTLLDMLVVAESFGTGFPTVTFTVHRVITDALLESRDLQLKELTIQVAGCERWLGIQGFTKIDGLGSQPLALTVNYDEVMSRSWKIAEGLTIVHSCRPNIKEQRSPTRGFAISESHMLTIESATPKPVDEMVRLLSKFFRLIEFAMDGSILMQHVTGHVESGDQNQLEINAPWIQSTKELKENNFPFVRFKVLEDNFGEIIQSWFELYDKIPLALDLYGTCKRTSGLQVEFRFFGIVAALESFHRSVHDDGPEKRSEKRKRPFGKPLEQRLRELLTANPDLIEEVFPLSACKKIADTRNYLAHQTPDLGVKAFPLDQWFFLYRKLSLVFEICLLGSLPLSDPDAKKNIVRRRLESIRAGHFGEWGT